MKHYKILLIALVIFVLISVLGGCFFRTNRIDKKIAWEYVEEYEEEILILYDMYQALEESGSEDYTEIRKYREDILMKEYPFLEFYYYKGWDKMEIWFDNNHDGYDWAVLYTTDPEFDMNSKANEETYEVMGNGFYIYSLRVF